MSENKENNSSDLKPVIADKMPAVKKLEAGEYWWCSCGKSSKQPFCDGSHQGSSFQPQKIVLEEAKNVALCNCKHSATVPFVTEPTQGYNST